MVLLLTLKFHRGRRRSCWGADDPRPAPPARCSFRPVEFVWGLIAICISGMFFWSPEHAADRNLGETSPRFPTRCDAAHPHDRGNRNLRDGQQRLDMWVHVFLRIGRLCDANGSAAPIGPGAGHRALVEMSLRQSLTISHGSISISSPDPSPRHSRSSPSSPSSRPSSAYCGEGQGEEKEPYHNGWIVC
jgi:hypothetical protein